MEVRITFRSELLLEGNSMEEIKDKWEYLPIFSADALEDCEAQVLEVVSVEDANTYEDLKDQFES